MNTKFLLINSIFLLTNSFINAELPQNVHDQVLQAASRVESGDKNHQIIPFLSKDKEFLTISSENLVNIGKNLVEQNNFRDFYHYFIFFQKDLSTQELQFFLNEIKKKLEKLPTENMLTDVFTSPKYMSICTSGALGYLFLANLNTLLPKYADKQPALKFLGALSCVTAMAYSYFMASYTVFLPRHFAQVVILALESELKARAAKSEFNNLEIQ